MIIRIPGRVWYDSLDPKASGMETELGLPDPRVQKKGRGETFIYEDVDPEVALEVAEYLGDRAATLGAQWGIEALERELYRAMATTAFTIRRAAQPLLDTQPTRAAEPYTP